MSDSKGDLLVAETRVGSVQYSAHARRRIEEFEVAVRVPGERRDAVARCNPEDTKSLRSLTRTLVAAVPVIPPNRPIDSLRDDLPLAVRARAAYSNIPLINSGASCINPRNMLHPYSPHCGFACKIQLGRAHVRTP